MANIPELNRVLDFIKANPEKHDQRCWSNDCGTAACLAGWACLLNGYTVRNSIFFNSDDDTVEPGDTAREIFDIGLNDSVVLFNWTNTVDELESMVGDLAAGHELISLWRLRGHDYVRVSD